MTDTETKALAIDADITAVIDVWASSVGTADHARAAGQLDNLLVDLTAARKFRDRMLHESREKIEFAWMDGRDARPVETLSELYPELENELRAFFAAIREHYEEFDVR